MNLKIELTLNVQGSIEHEDMHSIDVLIADDMVKLLAQFNLLVITIDRHIQNLKLKEFNKNFEDDIPF